MIDMRIDDLGFPDPTPVMLPGLRGGPFRICHLDGKGRGVCATANIAAGTILERAPVIVVPQSGVASLRDTPLFDYYFAWGPEGTDAAIALGIGSCFNHSYQPNAYYFRDQALLEIAFVALTPILAGEEITINYNGQPTDTAPLWFDAR